MEVILFQPQIPQNTGNIARTCALTGVKLLLAGPISFSLSSRQMRRSGLDYWPDVSIQRIDNLNEKLNSGKPFYFFSSKAPQLYTEPLYEPDCLLIFGSESSGLPLELHAQFPERFFTLPMAKPGRSLNLSNTVSIVIYEALRQQQFAFHTANCKSLL